MATNKLTYKIQVKKWGITVMKLTYLLSLGKVVWLPQKSIKLTKEY